MSLTRAAGKPLISTRMNVPSVTGPMLGSGTGGAGGIRLGGCECACGVPTYNVVNVAAGMLGQIAASGAVRLAKPMSSISFEVTSAGDAARHWPRCVRPAAHRPSLAFRFCGSCGAALTAAPGAADAGPSGPDHVPTAERRVTSVLFGDLVGFTTLSEARDPEEVRELLSRYFDTARAIVARYGGTIEKFIGDAVMAVWGVPTAHEDDAERAVRAGLGYRRGGGRVRGIGRGARVWRMRVGVVTGEVAVTLGATGEGMVAGDAVNTAARVQAKADPGTVWVDAQTRALAGGSIDFADAGAHELKGKAEPVAAVRGDRGRWAASAAIAAATGCRRRWSGRRRELSVLKEMFHAAAEEGRPRLVILSGDAGVGKTRLGRELENYLDGLSTDGAVAQRPLPGLRRRGGLLRTDRGRPRPDRRQRGRHRGEPRDKLTASARELRARRRGAGPAVAGADQPARADRRRRRADPRRSVQRVADLVRAAVPARRRPRGVGRRRRALRRRRIPRLRRAPVARSPRCRCSSCCSPVPSCWPAGRPGRAAPGERDRARDAFARRHRRPARRLVEGLPGDVRDALVDRAEGNPLFAIETVRAMHDQGLTVAGPTRHPGAVRLATGRRRGRPRRAGRAGEPAGARGQSAGPAAGPRTLAARGGVGARPDVQPRRAGALTGLPEDELCRRPARTGRARPADHGHRPAVGRGGAVRVRPDRRAHRGLPDAVPARPAAPAPRGRRVPRVLRRRPTSELSTVIAQHLRDAIAMLGTDDSAARRPRRHGSAAGWSARPSARLPSARRAMRCACWKRR